MWLILDLCLFPVQSFIQLCHSTWIWKLLSTLNSWLWPIHAEYETHIAIGYPYLCVQKKRFYAVGLHQLTIMSPSLYSTLWVLMSPIQALATDDNLKPI